MSRKSLVRFCYQCPTNLKGTAIYIIWAKFQHRYYPVLLLLSVPFLKNKNINLIWKRCSRKIYFVAWEDIICLLPFLHQASGGWILGQKLTLRILKNIYLSSIPRKPYIFTQWFTIKTVCKKHKLWFSDLWSHAHWQEGQFCDIAGGV